MILQVNMSVLMEAATTLKEIVEEDAKLRDNFNYMQSTMDIIVNILFFKLMVDFLLINKQLTNSQPNNNEYILKIL